MGLVLGITKSAFLFFFLVKVHKVHKASAVDEGENCEAVKRREKCKAHKTGSFTFFPSTESFTLAIKSPLTACVAGRCAPSPMISEYPTALAALHVC